MTGGAASVITDSIGRLGMRRLMCGLVVVLLALVVAVPLIAGGEQRCKASTLSLIHISEPTRPFTLSRMPSSA